MDNFHDFIDYLYEDLYQYHPIKRYLRDAENPLEYFDDVEFQRRFRFRKDTITNVLLPLLNLTQSANNRGLPIPPLLQVLIAVRFYATGNFQIVCGDLHKLSQPVVSRIVTRISKVLVLKISHYIKFPNADERSDVKRKFYQRAGFPGIVGAIDCTHVPIKNPRRENGEVYRNRKGFFSVNVQIVCGPHLEIYDIVARWPGSVHDSRIFTNSRCRMRFEEGDLRNSGILLGDSGYAQTSYMFTPILNPQTPPQQRYNRSQISTRNVIERVNGVLKRRFACLSRKLQNKITTVPNIIVSCAILHNISILTNEELPEPLREPEIALPVVQENERGSIIRNNFILRHFT